MNEFKYIITDEDGKSHVFRDYTVVEIEDDLIRVWNTKGLLAEFHNWHDVSKRKIVISEHINNGSKDNLFGYHCVMNYDKCEMSITMKTTGDMGELAYYLRMGLDYRAKVDFPSKDVIQLEEWMSKHRQECLA